MSWEQLLASRRVQSHTTHTQELHGLYAVVARDLKDAALPDLSSDRRFAIAYNAVLQLATMVIACSGYRVRGVGHHRTTFEALELAMGHSITTYAVYFDTCRRKRNLVEYDLANGITETEARELMEKAHAFHQLIEVWIAQHYPGFTP
jgi:HEPN superfamily protein